MGLTIHSGILKDRLILVADDLRRSSAMAARLANDLKPSENQAQIESLELVRKILIDNEYFLLSCAREISEGIIIRVPKSASRNQRA